MTDFRSYIRDVPDFPSPGILFRDVTPLLADADAFGAAVRAMAEPFRAEPPAKILGIEARGFLFGTALARELGVGFVPARKPGKLPRATRRVFYGLEYGKDCLEVHADAFARGRARARRRRRARDRRHGARGGGARGAAGSEVVGISVLHRALRARRPRKRLGGRPISRRS